MKKILFILTGCFISIMLSAQTDRSEVEKTCLNYIEGFYEGDTAKLIQSLQPSLYKFGYYKNSSGKYAPDGNMTYRQALDYATKVLQRKNFAKPGSPKKVTIMDIGNSIAAVKVTAWWGIDYILLSKQEGKWMIDQVLWEGPLPG